MDQHPETGRILAEILKGLDTAVLLLNGSEIWRTDRVRASPFTSLISVSPRVATLPPTSVGDGCFAVESGSLATGRPTYRPPGPRYEVLIWLSDAAYSLVMRYRAQLPT